MNIEDHINDVLEKLFQNSFNNREDMEWDLLGLLKNEFRSPKTLALLVIKAFTGEKSVFEYLDKHCDSKDKLIGKSKEMLLNFVHKFLQMHPMEVLPHLRLVFRSSFKVFRKDEASQVKVASLCVLKKILKVSIIRSFRKKCYQKSSKALISCLYF